MCDRIFVVNPSDERLAAVMNILQERGRETMKSGEKIPFAKKAVYVLAPNQKITSENVKGFKEESVVFCGKIEGKIDGEIRAKKLLVYEFLKYGQFVTKNAIYTAKSLLITILKWCKIGQNKPKILVAGFGKVGRATVEELRNVCSRIDILTSRPEEAVIYGNPIAKNDCNLGNYDLIVSTVPCNIFFEEDLAKIKKGAKLIELASPPYSFDLGVADSLDIDYQVLPSLPAKVLPVQSAELICEFVFDKEKEYD